MTSGDDNEAMQIGPDPDKLFVYHRQQLSAMLDGELSPDEAKFMLRRLQHDAELAACWERWQVCGDMLRGQRNALLPSDFAQRVAMAMGVDAPVADAPGRVGPPSRPRLVRWGGGAAIAASVALLAVFAGRQLPDAAPVPGDSGTAPIIAANQTPVSPVATNPGVIDALADAGDRQPVAPVQDASAAALAAAVAVAEVPRRAGERRANAQAQRAASTRRAVAQRDSGLATAIAANAVSVPNRLPDPVAAPSVDDRFAMPGPTHAVARPWPRALLPAGDSTFTVGLGQLPREPVFEPFRPRDVAVLPSVRSSEESPTQPAQGAPTQP